MLHHDDYRDSEWSNSLDDFGNSFKQIVLLGQYLFIR